MTNEYVKRNHSRRSIMCEITRLEAKVKKLERELFLERNTTCTHKCSATVDDAMVERACTAMWGDDDGVHPADQRTIMRAALVAALEGRT